MRNSPQRPKTSPTQNGAHRYSKISKQRLQSVKQHSLNRRFNRLFRRRRTLCKMAIKNPIQKIGCPRGRAIASWSEKQCAKFPRTLHPVGCLPSLLFSSLSIAGNLKRFVFDANHQIFLLHLRHLCFHRIFAVFLNNFANAGSSLAVIASYS